MEFKIIFDTNILYVNYDKGGDFTKFYFNSTFKNVIDSIEKSDLYEHIGIMVPEIIWKEMKEQKIEGYLKKKSELEAKINKIVMPEAKFEIKELNYDEYIQLRINEYKDELSENLIKIEEIKLPSKECFGSIINRAFNKLPPFEGKDKKSDKGFKDTLLWESIIEYKRENQDKKLILYTSDKMFNNDLCEEYKNIFNQEIKIITSEEEIISLLNQLSKTINDYVYVNEEVEEINKIKIYLKSIDFSQILLEDLSGMNIFSDVYMIEDINNLEISNITSYDYNENKFYNAELEFNLLFNKVNGTIEDIIEKREYLKISFGYENDKIKDLEYEYNNTYFTSGGGL